MSNYDTKIHSNPDAQAWAKFFIQTKEEKKLQIEDIDESLMMAWFANAMMAMHDHLKSQRKPEQEPIKESSVTHSHLWISDLYGKDKHT